MAKLTDSDKINLIADWKTGRFSHRSLVEKYNASKGTVGNLTKGIEPKNGQYVDAQITLLTAKSILSDEEMGAIIAVAQNEIFERGLITNATQLNLVRITQHLKDNKKLEKINIGNGVQNLEEVELGSSDYKNIQDAIDKASLTLGVNQRHSSQQINVQTNTAIQNNTNIKNLPENELEEMAERYGIVLER